MYQNVEFDIMPDQLQFNTQTNGDKLRISGINLDANQAAALAYLINQPESLKIEIKVKS